MKENKNQVINNKVENTAVENNEAVQFINENINVVPKIMYKRFMNLSVEEQVAKIKHYIQRNKQIEEWREHSKMVNRVKDLFEKRHATVQDAQEVMKYCTEFINNFKQTEIDRLDAEIAKLQAMKNSIL